MEGVLRCEPWWLCHLRESFCETGEKGMAVVAPGVTRQVSPAVLYNNLCQVAGQVDIWTISHLTLLHAQRENFKLWAFKIILCSRQWISSYVILHRSFKNMTFKGLPKETSTKISWKGAMNIIKILHVFSVIPGIYTNDAWENGIQKYEKSSRRVIAFHRLGR